MRTANSVHTGIKVAAGEPDTVTRQTLVAIATGAIKTPPSQAGDFLEPACETLRRDGGILHYYTFADGLDSESKARKELTNAIDSSVWTVENPIATHKVRGVAPMKWQIAVDAKLEPA